ERRRKHWAMARDFKHRSSGARMDFDSGFWSLPCKSCRPFEQGPLSWPLIGVVIGCMLAGLHPRDKSCRRASRSSPWIAAASSQNDQGSMNLASNTASVPSTIPSRVAAIHGIAVVPDLALHVSDLPPGVALIPGAIEVLGRPSELHDEVAGQVLRFASPRFSRRHSRTRAASSLPIMIRASE